MMEVVLILTKMKRNKNMNKIQGKIFFILNSKTYMR